MKIVLLLLFVTFFPFLVFSQDASLARLRISGRFSELGISPSEEVWVATNSGHVYHTKRVGDLWRFGPFGSSDENDLDPANDFERLNFLTEDTLMISGFIQENGKQNFVYWSGNHGKEWEKIVFGEDSWIDAVHVSKNGKIWMSGSSQLIYYSENKGKSWQELNKVEASGNLRFIAINFSKDEQTGLFGSTSNTIYKTTDNCKTWKKIPTPLDQQKYKTISRQEQPWISKIRIFGSYYIISQQGKTFITKSDRIDWTYLPDAAAFEVTEKDNLYLIRNDLRIERYNSNFDKIWQSEQRLDARPTAIAVKNDKLFALTPAYIYKLSPDQFVSSQLFTNEIAIPEPALKVKSAGTEFGFENRDILYFDQTQKKWSRFMTLDFPIANAALFNQQIIISGMGLNQHYVLNPGKKSIADFQFPVKLFSRETVTALRFEYGERGCFSMGSNLNRSYVKKADKFILDKTQSTAGFITKTPEEIDQHRVNKLIEEIEKSWLSDVPLADLQIADQDIEEFKSFIDKEQQRIKKEGFERHDFDHNFAFPGENTDFNFYKSVADSLAKVSIENINSALKQGSGIWSTSRSWRRVIFGFENGKKLVVENSDYRPNYLNTPWLLEYDGLKLTSNSVKFGADIDQLTKEEFFDKSVRDKKYAIFKIADYMYRKELR